MVSTVEKAAGSLPKSREQSAFVGLATSRQVAVESTFESSFASDRLP
jgi:hypothetical protein